MTKEFIKANFPGVYDEIFQEGFNYAEIQYGISTEDDFILRNEDVMLDDEEIAIDNVPVSVIDEMADLFESTDYNTLKDIIFNGKWQEYAMDYVHPMDSLRDTCCFKEIQAAFINGYV